MKLFYSKGSCSMAPVLVAHALELDIPKEMVSLATGKLSNGQIFSDINAKGYVPALALENGDILTEVVAICDYLCSLKPEQTLFPKEPIARAKQLEWFNYLSTELHKNYVPQFMKLFGKKPGTEWLSHSEQMLNKRYQYIENVLSKQAYLMGTELSCVDFYLYVICSWSGLVNYDLSAFPAIKTFIEKMSQHPSIQACIS